MKSREDTLMTIGIAAHRLFSCHVPLETLWYLKHCQCLGETYFIYRVDDYSYYPFDFSPIFLRGLFNQTRGFTGTKQELLIIIIFSIIFSIIMNPDSSELQIN
jgi:hypothetical protein